MFKAFKGKGVITNKEMDLSIFDKYARRNRLRDFNRLVFWRFRSISAKGNSARYGATGERYKITELLFANLNNNLLHLRKNAII